MSRYKSSQLKHIVSHPQQLYMILNDYIEDLNVCLRIQLEDFDYVLFTSEHMKCFGCGEMGQPIEHVLQNIINQCLESSWSIGETQGHDKVFVVSLVC